jgi:dTDP-4-dehydrorhamnose reductase
MRVLITGAGGQLGTELVGVCSSSGDDVVAASHAELDIADREQVLQTIAAVNPDVVLHCAAMTNVDRCETDPTRAYLLNSLGARHVAEAVDLADARMVHVSTDYVFDGRGTGPNGGGPYVEWDPTGPLSHYGRSKLGGEHEVSRILGSRAAIVRVSWLVGQYGNNFLKTMLRLARDSEAKPVTVVNDQRGCPTFSYDLAVTMRQLALARANGVFHVSNAGAVSWCEFASAIFTAAGADATRVIPISTAELLPARPAPRPAFSILENAALVGSGFTPMPSWQPQLAATIAALS